MSDLSNQNGSDLPVQQKTIEAEPTDKNTTEPATAINTTAEHMAAEKPMAENSKTINTQTDNLTTMKNTALKQPSTENSASKENSAIPQSETNTQDLSQSNQNTASAASIAPPQPAEEEDSLSMVDVLQDEVQMEAEAHAVLGGSDATQCTYDQGYIDRQALYACITCKTNDDTPAGFCLACSLECHEGHSLYELYTKRNFQCDCGNKKYIDSKCKMTPVKADFNEENIYSQNFRGLYCICHRPYPDPEDEIEDEMIQCCVCEDWYHGRHIGLAEPQFDHDEMICQLCMKRLDFLFKYAALFPLMHPTSAEKVQKVDLHITEDIDITKVTAANKTTDTKKDDPSTNQKDVPNNESAAVTNNSSGDKQQNSTVTADKQQDSMTTPSADVSKDDSGADECKLSLLSAFTVEVRTDGATYWPENWREKLCTCSKCKLMYERLGVTFLTNSADTVLEYEKRGAAKPAPETRYETGMKALQSMDRIQQVEVLSEYNSMKDELTDYLKKFAENKKLVREEDIREFFQDLESRKRQRVSMPHFCK